MDRSDIPTRKLVIRIGLRFLLILALLLFIILLLPPLLNLFFPFVLALLVASLLAPLVSKFTKKKDGTFWHFWSMLFVILLILAVTGLLVGLGYYLFSQISDLYGSWESIQVASNNLVESISEFLETNQLAGGTYLEQYAVNLIQQVLNWITTKVSTWIPTLVSSVGNMASGLASFLISLLFFIVGAYFMTADYPRLRDKISSWIPEVIHPHMHHIKSSMGTATFGYLKAQLILSGIVTLIIFFTLSIMGLKYALIIAILCGIIDVIPFFGSGTVLVPWAVVEAFLGNYSRCLWLVILAFILFIFRKLAEPKVVGNQTGLPPIVSLISIYVGMKLGGVLGMILTPILCMIILSLYGVGFFDPTISDFKLLFSRILQYAAIKSENNDQDSDG